MLVEVGDGYPLDAPVVRFEGPKVKMPAVNDQGKVDLGKLEGADLKQCLFFFFHFLRFSFLADSPSLVDDEGMVTKGTGEYFKWDPYKHDIIGLFPNLSRFFRFSCSPPS